MMPEPRLGTGVTGMKTTSLYADILATETGQRVSVSWDRKREKKI